MTRLRTQDAVHRQLAGEPARSYRIATPVPPEPRVIAMLPIIGEAVLIAGFISVIVLALVAGGAL